MESAECLRVLPPEPTIVGLHAFHVLREQDFSQLVDEGFSVLVEEIIELSNELFLNKIEFYTA